ncbi:acyl-CoA desaturase [Veronia pacifica]|uniref:Acyl-CoA desaturase n=1 Tax=Veronia pacifica TaxID=1080227 RepID=A0A1C3EG86_9GAMM|nr:fatty acid desaturase [Veronia pacifica]ODA32229.1 acyl-CoA desaturase [Veronia pacifica]
MDSHHKEQPKILWLNVGVFALTFAVAIIGTPLWAWHHGFDLSQIAMLLAAFTFTGMSITAGYHRLWSHKSYEANVVLKVIFALGGAFAIQNSILHWSSDHRIHHRHVDDNDNDPYSAQRGFWFSHIGWMLRDYQNEKYNDYSNCRDLQKDKVVMWQHKYYLLLVLLTNFGIPLVFGVIHGDVWGALILIGFTRLVLNHHCTFFINSLAHIWGSQPYTDKNSARDNGLLALFTFGEGYHNFHHIFENDYRNGIHWWQFDPTKWLIKLGSWVGLTTRLRVTPEERIEKAKAKMLLVKLQKRLSVTPENQRRLQLIQIEYDALLARMADYYNMKKRFFDLRKRKLLKKYEKADLLQQLNKMKAELQQQRKTWYSLAASYSY